ncbi:Mss4-like protein [Filobasidium floriforme]|uniref:Mss4-like protein n=1 Tax=Filobasidium floriforme TaxID=5210 RepID=UPI001E8DC9E4|nr:Mss4-like protein [Filobasidium floriforme]KAH8081968.1 Mss4-like protein [Filobasidium floriforme]
MSFSNTMTGACFCGNVTYDVINVNAETLDGIICHCKSCQRLHTMVSYNVALDKDQLRLTKGEPKMYEDFHADSGKRIVRFFCGDCGSALYSYPDSMPDKVFAKAGSLDQLERVIPKVEIFIERVINGTTREAKARKTTLFEGMMAKQLS